jgi:hypothetical protein
MDADSHVVSSALSVFSEMRISAESASDLQQAIDLTARRQAERNSFDVIFVGNNFPKMEQHRVHRGASRGRGIRIKRRSSSPPTIMLACLMQNVPPARMDTS